MRALPSHSGLTLYARARRLAGRSLVAGLLREVRRCGHIAMFHVGRSGSTVLGDLLNQHPLIRWDAEIYQKIFRRYENSDSSLQPIVGIDPARYLQQRARTVTGAYYGFETKFFHIRLLGTQLAPYLEDLERRCPRMRYVVLERRNTLSKIVSGMIARDTGTWHVDTASALPPKRSIRVDIEAAFVDREYRPLLELLHEYAQDFSDLERHLAHRRSLHLTYEDDVRDDPRRAYQRVCDFLDIPRHDPQVNLKRTNPYPVRDLIENVGEVRNALRGTGFEWMLDDGG